MGIAKRQLRPATTPSGIEGLSEYLDTNNSAITELFYCITSNLQQFHSPKTYRPTDLSRTSTPLHQHKITKEHYLSVLRGSRRKTDLFRGILEVGKPRRCQLAH